MHVPAALFTAASHDNVPLLALLACEQYGSVIESKINTPSKNNTITALQSTEGGRQFLAYAIALINSEEMGDKAEIIHNALRKSAVDEELMPRLSAIQRLLQTIKAGMNGQDG